MRLKTEIKVNADRIVGPQCLERYAPFFLVIEALLLLFGAFFWVDAVKGASQFSPSIWGNLAVSLPAEFWAALNIGASAICLIGLIDPVHRKMVAVGQSIHTIKQAALTYSMFFTGGDPVIGLYVSTFFLTLHVTMAGIAASGWKR